MKVSYKGLVVKNIQEKSVQHVDLYCINDNRSQCDLGWQCGPSRIAVASFAPCASQIWQLSTIKQYNCPLLFCIATIWYATIPYKRDSGNSYKRETGQFLWVCQLNLLLNDGYAVFIHQMSFFWQETKPTLCFFIILKLLHYCKFNLIL